MNSKFIKKSIRKKCEKNIKKYKKIKKYNDKLLHYQMLQE